MAIKYFQQAINHLFYIFSFFFYPNLVKLVYQDSSGAYVSGSWTKFPENPGSLHLSQKY